MGNPELDAVLSARVKACVASMHPSTDLADRLRCSIHQSQRAFGVRLAALVVLVVTATMLMVGLVGRDEACTEKESALIAADGHADKEKVSGWMVLGLFRDIFKKNNKRKEENAR